jgi:hypothetical protein
MNGGFELYKRQLITLYTDLTSRVTRNLRSSEGDADYNLIQGRNKGHVIIFELVSERADVILDLAEKDPEAMFAYVNNLIDRIMMPPKSVKSSIIPDYYRGEKRDTEDRKSHF